MRMNHSFTHSRERGRLAIMESFCVSLESMSESQDIWEQEEILESCLYLDPSRVRSKTDSICKEAQVSYENRTELATGRRSLQSHVHRNDCLQGLQTKYKHAER